MTAPEEEAIVAKLETLMSACGFTAGDLGTDLRALLGGGASAAVRAIVDGRPADRDRRFNPTVLRSILHRSVSKSVDVPQPALGAQCVGDWLDAWEPPILAEEARRLGLQPMEDLTVAVAMARDVAAPEAARTIGHLLDEFDAHVGVVGSEPGSVDEARLDRYCRATNKPPPIGVGWDVVVYLRLEPRSGEWRPSMNRRLQHLRLHEIMYRAAPETVRTSAFEFMPSHFGPGERRLPSSAAEIHALWASFDRDLGKTREPDADGRKLRLLGAPVGRQGDMTLQMSRYAHFWYRTVNDGVVHASFTGRYRQSGARSPFGGMNPRRLASLVERWREELRPDWLNFAFVDGDRPEDPIPRTGSMLTCHQSVSTADGLALMFQRGPGQDYQAGSFTFGFEEQASPSEDSPLPKEEWSRAAPGDPPFLHPGDLYEAGPDLHGLHTAWRGLQEELGVEGQYLLPQREEHGKGEDGGRSNSRARRARPTEPPGPIATIAPYALAFEVNAANAILLSHVHVTTSTSDLRERWTTRLEDDRGRRVRDLELRRSITVPFTFEHLLPVVLHDSACRTAFGHRQFRPGLDHAALHGGRAGSEGAPLHESSPVRAFVALADAYGWDRTVRDVLYWGMLWRRASWWWELRTGGGPAGGTGAPVPAAMRTFAGSKQGRWFAGRVDHLERGDWPGWTGAGEELEIVHTWFWYALLFELLEDIVSDDTGRSLGIGGFRKEWKRIMSRGQRRVNPRNEKWFSARWTYEPSRPRPGKGGPGVPGPTPEPNGRASMVAVIETLLARTSRGQAPEWRLRLEMLFEAWRRARLARHHVAALEILRTVGARAKDAASPDDRARPTSSRPAAGGFDPRPTVFETALEDPAVSDCVTDTGWNSLMRVHNMILLYFAVDPSPPRQLRAVNAKRLVPEMDGRPPAPPTADIRQARALLAPIRSSDDTHVVQLTRFVHPLSDARLPMPLWSLRAVPLSEVVAIRRIADDGGRPGSGRPFQVAAAGLAKEALDFIGHRREPPSDSVGPPIGPIRLSVALGFDHSSLGLLDPPADPEDGRPGWSRWSRVHPVTGTREELAALLSKPASFTQRVVRDAIRRALPGSLQRDRTLVSGLARTAEILGLAYDARGWDVQLLVVCSCDALPARMLGSWPSKSLLEDHLQTAARWSVGDTPPKLRLSHTDRALLFLLAARRFGWDPGRSAVVDAWKTFRPKSGRK